jgi:hypothetical protein
MFVSLLVCGKQLSDAVDFERPVLFLYWQADQRARLLLLTATSPCVPIQSQWDTAGAQRGHQRRHPVQPSAAVFPCFRPNERLERIYMPL